MSISDSTESESDFESVSLAVEHIGGIDQMEVAFDPGVTLLTGQNATNRTSLLSALGGALGGSSATLKSDTDEGYVSLTVGEDEYTRTYTRTETGVQTTGTAYTDDETVVDLFVTLLEDNPARQAVKRGDDLRELIMRPVDTAAIRSRINDLKAEQRSLEEEIDTIEQRRNRLPSLEERRNALSDEIDEIDQDIADLREEVASFEASLETAEEAADAIEELNERRHDLSDVEDRIEVVEAELEALKDERTELSEELADLPDTVEDERDSIEEELQVAQEQRVDLDETIDSLVEIIDFNDDLLGGSQQLSEINPDERSITDELAPEDERTVVCWTCGSHVDRGAIDDRLDDLRDVVTEKRDTRSELDDRIADLQAQRDELQEQLDKRAQIERNLERTEEKITARQDDLANLRDKKAEIQADIEALETQAAETEQLRESDLLDKYERISDLQYERGQQEQQLQDIKDEITEIEELPDRETLEDQLDEIQAELDTERGRIEDLERTAVEAFNDHMSDLLSVLDYKNLARVWIERKTSTSGRSSARSDAEFDLHIVRESNDGTVYEDEVTNLSESEREVIGLVVALAGYLVHEVYERIPFILLDSVEAIDAERIADLVGYFAEFTPYLLVALLPEDADALPGSYEQISVDTVSE